MNPTPWIFPARYDLVRCDIVDGDTFDLIVDLGFRVNCKARIRLARVDTAEIFGVEQESEEYNRGIAQKELTEEFVRFSKTGEPDFPFLIRTFSAGGEIETGKYGRWPAVVYSRNQGEILNRLLIEEFGDSVYIEDGRDLEGAGSVEMFKKYEKGL